MTVKSHRLIYSNPHGYSAWPSILVLRDGTWAVFFCEAMRRKRKTHRDPTFHNMFLRSADGKNWDEMPVVVPGYDFYGMDDPGAVQLKSGDILVNAFRFLHAPLTSPANREGFPWTSMYEKTFVHRSSDGGSTWSTTVIDPAPYRVACTLRPIVECCDDSLVMGCYDEVAKPSVCFTVRSRDGGRTWGRPFLLAADSAIAFYEPCLLETGGRLVALLRTHKEGENRLFQCESTDGGETWNPPRPTNMVGYPAHAIELHDGRLLCVYGVRWEPFGIRARLSIDKGRTWEDREIIIRDDFPNGDLGYPTAVQHPDGTVTVAYYGQDADGVTSLFTSTLQL